MSWHARSGLRMQEARQELADDYRRLNTNEAAIEAARAGAEERERARLERVAKFLAEHPELENG